ncbi:MAG TPA: hypothetical protein PK537_10200 [Candidatus Limiplasma sp.]|nr:hypothetical protein [Candidatus Limiplasma sp.]
MNYNENTHRFGRFWVLTVIVLLLLVPVSIGLYYQVLPDMNGLWRGLLGVVPIFWTVGAIEVLTFTPMLGAGGTYLAFITGNLTNLKVPCVLNALQAADVKQGTEEAEVLSTIAIAVSSFVTMGIIALGVLLIAQIQPLIESETLQPAFDNILPALFGGLGVVFITKSWKIAIAPLIFMVTLFVLVPSLASSVGILVPVGAAIAIGVSRVLYQKNLL